MIDRLMSNHKTYSQFCLKSFIPLQKGPKEEERDPKNVRLANHDFELTVFLLFFYGNDPKNRHI